MIVQVTQVIYVLYFVISINIINSKGEINSINIKNSFQDAVDLDFSDLNIQKINIENAGNDCVDISSGNYKIENIIAYKCFDKGVSIGEKSNVNVFNLIVNNAQLGLVVKDSSNVDVLKSNIYNYSQCAAVYRKKQEFGSSFLAIPKSTCPNDKTFVQFNSTIIYR